MNPEFDAFVRSLASNMRILRESYQVFSLEVRPIDSSSLYLRDDSGKVIPLFLPSDNIIGLLALLNRHWEISKPRFLNHVVASIDDEVLLVDVGANVGLFSRQCLSLTPRISAIYAYEPHPSNFSLLCRNLCGVGKAQLNNFGLGRETSTLTFYMDPENAGNYSLNQHAMPEKFETTAVEIVKAEEEERKWLAHGKPIFYKSDVQGFDEVIATSLSLDFWGNVCGGVFELWRIPGKEYDLDLFMRIIDSFNYKVFENKPTEIVSSAEVLTYLLTTDNHTDDLLFWRK